MMIGIKDVMEERLCYEKIRELRWSEGVRCPHCSSLSYRRKGHHPHCEHRHCYQCKACQRHYDDLTNTIFQDHAHPLKNWVACLALLRLGVTEAKIAQELDLSENDCRALSHRLREKGADLLYSLGMQSRVAVRSA